MIFLSGGVTSLALVLGTRPEIIKLAPVVEACERRNIPYTLIHTGQHYSDGLDSDIFDQLNLRPSDHHIGVGSGTHGEQTGEMLAKVESVLIEETPDTVLVQGDTNSVLAGAIAASKLDPNIGHVEAGLRSYDREMPEEINRIVTDHVADYLFAPTEATREILEGEGIPSERIHVTGNTVVDAVQTNRERAMQKSSIMDELEIEHNNFALLTAHRSENVDDADRLARILTSANSVANELGVEVVYPVHPRTEQRLTEFNLSLPERITPTDPLKFLDFLRLEDAAALALTDSGGVQEESCILGTPCVTIRDSTERPETVRVGANTVAGVDPDEILSASKSAYRRDGDWENPFGDGNAAERILDAVLDVTGRT